MPCYNMLVDCYGSTVWTWVLNSSITLTSLAQQTIAQHFSLFLLIFGIGLLFSLARDWADLKYVSFFPKLKANSFIVVGNAVWPADGWGSDRPPQWIVLFPWPLCCKSMDTDGSYACVPQIADYLSLCIVYPWDCNL